MPVLRLTVWLFLSCFFTPLWAVEPPFIVEQAEPAPVPEQEETELDMPTPKTLSTTQQVKTIRVEHVQFQGGTVFELEQLATMVQPLIGKDVSRVEIVKVLRAITDLYKQAGYALSFAQLPKQNTSDGRLTIVLVEGYIAQSEILVEDEQVRQRLTRIASNLQADRPLKRESFERNVKLIEATPGYRFKVRVPKPKTQGGGTTLRIEEVKATPYATSLGFDDSEHEELRLLGSLSVHNLTSYGDKLTLSGLLPNDTVNAYYGLNYQQDIGASGMQMSLAANHFDSEGDDRIFVADIPLNYEENKTRDRLSAGLKYPLQLSRQSAWWIGTTLHHLDEDSTFQLSRMDGTGSAVKLDKALRYSALELHSNWYKKSRRYVLSMSGSIKQGVDLFGNENELNDSGGTRKGSETTHFTSLRFDTSWRYMMTPRWRVQTKASLFWSDDVLPSAEQIRYGGPRFGRGYADGQAQGDEGVAAELEVRYLQPVAMSIIKRLEPYLAVDSAHTALRANEREQDLASVALGMDVTDGKHYTVGLEYAKPLADSHIESGSRSPIYNLRVRWQF
jgi:hemolysin activation/secretion protein